MQSELVRMTLSTGKVVQRMKGFGRKAHGLVHWGNQLLALDSASSALMLVQPTSKSIERLWQVTFQDGQPCDCHLLMFALAPGWKILRCCLVATRWLVNLFTQAAAALPAGRDWKNVWQQLSPWCSSTCLYAGP